MKIEFKDPGLENQRLIDIFRQSPISIELYDSSGIYDIQVQELIQYE